MKSKIRNLIIILAFFGALFLSEPLLRYKLTFAITYSEHPTVPYEKIPASQRIKPLAPKPVQQKSHAPEPSTLLLILSGISGMVIRFAQKSFAKFKRAMDYFLSILGLTLTLPILAIAAAMIKLTSKGPAIYKQYRVGEAGKIFRIYKLRTMRFDAEKYTGAVWAKENDPRITLMGRLLRKTHIDEIPQFLNVIKGEMSIVGPRPERPEMVRDLKEVICDYEKRLQVKPGITGLAQVLHKYDETIADVKKKIKYDILYIKRMCWLVEMRILAQTFVVALTGKGAR